MVKIYHSKLAFIIEIEVRKEFFWKSSQKKVVSLVYN